ncbi:MAG TPA: PilZ domain-containing protein [Sphingomicrobium sp.]
MSFEGRIEGREWHSRNARIDVRYDVLVRSAEGVVRARVVNVSNKGFRLRSRRVLEPGLEVMLETPKGAPVHAIIRWATGLDAGGVFVEPVAL